MVVYYINKVNENLRTYTFPFKKGDICMLHEGDIVKTVYIDSEVENNSIFRDFRYVDTKSLTSYQFPNTNIILCAPVPYGRGKAKGDKALVSLLLTYCNGEWLTDFLIDTLAVLEGTREYWDQTVLCRLTREENIDIVFETPIEEASINRMLKLVYIPEPNNFSNYSKELDLSVGDYCFCHVANGIVLIQIDKEPNIIDKVSDFRLIENVDEPEIMLPLDATILYDSTSVKENKFLPRLDSIVKLPVSKSILFCALNDLPLSEEEDVKDYLEGEDGSNIFSENRHLSSLVLEIIEIFENKIEQRSYSILLDLANGLSRSEVAKKNNLTQERIRQLYNKILEEIKFLLINEVKENEQVRKDNARLHVQIQLYIEEIQQLRKAVMSESFTESTGHVADINAYVAELLNTPIHKLELPLRAMKVLKVLGISTFGEIPRIDATVTLLKVKNSGRKTVHDIEAFLDKFGLQLGMTYTEVVNTLMNVDFSKISHFLK